LLNETNYFLSSTSFISTCFETQREESGHNHHGEAFGDGISQQTIIYTFTLIYSFTTVTHVPNVHPSLPTIFQPKTINTKPHVVHPPIPQTRVVHPTNQISVDLTSLTINNCFELTYYG